MNAPPIYWTVRNWLHQVHRRRFQSGNSGAALAAAPVIPGDLGRAINAAARLAGFGDSAGNLAAGGDPRGASLPAMVDVDWVSVSALGVLGWLSYSHGLKRQWGKAILSGGGAAAIVAGRQMGKPASTAAFATAGVMIGLYFMALEQDKKRGR